MSERLSREFFERDRRSTLIRNICLEALDASVRTSQGDEDALYELLDINKQLHTLGIKPGMYTLDDPGGETKRREDLENSPVLAAEWIAGQVRDALAHTAVFPNSSSASTIAEHDELLLSSVDSMSLIDMHAISPKTIEFLIDMTLIEAIRGFVDYSAGPSKIE